MEFARVRDVEFKYKGDAYAVLIDDSLRAGGWQGGQGVQWADHPTNDFRVTYSSGLYGGFLLWGSDESSDQWTAMTGQQIKYEYGILCTGSWLLTTRTFERYTYASRVGPGPLVPLIYTPGQQLRFSLRGWWTSEDEWTLSGDPRAPNLWYLATVVLPVTNNLRGVPYLTLQTNI